MKSKVEMELKIASTLKKKDRLVKKLKVKFVESAKEEEEEGIKRMKNKNKKKPKKLLH